MMHWIYLFIASLFEIGWMISLRALSFSELKKVRLLSSHEELMSGVTTILPLIGYIAFGLGNIYFFSLSMKQIPASTAFAVWMAMTLTGMRLVEIFVFKQIGSTSDYFFMFLLVVAVIGLKK